MPSLSQILLKRLRTLSSDSSSRTEILMTTRFLLDTSVSRGTPRHEAQDFTSPPLHLQRATPHRSPVAPPPPPANPRGRLLPGLTTPGPAAILARFRPGRAPPAPGGREVSAQR